MTNEKKKGIALGFVSALVAFSILVLIGVIYTSWGLVAAIGISAFLGVTTLMCKWLSLEDDPPKKENQDG